MITPYSNIISVTTLSGSLLDLYTGAAAAYSLRQLKSGVTNAIEVRRASDNATQDIGFVNNELDVTSLESFCSGTNGFVTTWYDQSGNGHDFEQTVAASQPQIVNSGVYLNSINLDLVDDYMVASSNYTPSSYQSIFTVFEKGSNTSGQLPLLANNNLNDNGVLYSNSINFSYWPVRRQGYVSSINYPISFNLYSFFKTGDGNASDVLEAYVNSNSSGTPQGTSTGNAGVLNYLNRSSTPDDKKIKEIIIYSSDQSSNRSGIETNINDFYSIYYVATNSEYQDVLDYADSQGYQRPSYAQQALQDALVGDLKDAGIWSKLDLFYVFPTDGDSDFASINWKDPNDYEITEVNSPTFTTNVGFTGNGTSALLYTNFNPLTDRVNYDPKGGDGQRFVWVGDTGSNGILISDEPAGSGGALDRMRLNNTGSGSNKIMTTSGGLSSALSGSGLWYTEFDGTNRNYYLNDTFVQAISSSATTDAYKTNWQLLGDSVYYDGNIKFHGIGSLLSATEQTDLYNALDTYNSSL